MSQNLFTANKIYNRRNDIHKVYGGNWQSGICPSRSFPFIFIFSGKSGKKHGYKDGWVNKDIFEYTGEGQVGDMEFTKGNLALRDQLENGKRVYLFEAAEKGYVKFICELDIFDYDYFDTHDREGVKRIGIKFFFKRVGIELKVNKTDLDIRAAAEVKPTYDLLLPNSTERQGLVTTRVGQGAYRKSIMHRWEYECAVTGFDNPKVLIASHIVPWSDSNDQQRLDVDNGILLSPNYDALFDKHLISFNEDGKIMLGHQISRDNLDKIGVTGSEIITSLSDNNQNYLEVHRQKLIYK